MCDVFSECRAGFEKQGENCVECALGDYKNYTADASCSQCGDGFTTREEGSIHQTQCSMQNIALLLTRIFTILNLKKMYAFFRVFFSM